MLHATFTLNAFAMMRRAYVHKPCGNFSIPFPSGAFWVVSTQTVLRRLKCWECVSVLRTTVGPMLDGSLNALLLPIEDFQQQMHKVSIAVADLSDLIMIPAPAGPVYNPGNSSSNLQQQSIIRRQGTGTRQADVCVLQLLLSFRVLELLAAVVDLAAVHGSRLAEKQAEGGLQCNVITVL